MTQFWRVLLTIAAGVGLIVFIGLPLYVVPRVDEVRESDAILVLGPPMDERLALAEQLRDEGFADEIVVSVQPSGGQTAHDLAICRDGEAICEVPDPFTTRGEVLLMSEQVSGSDAPSVIVLTTTPHVARTRYIFDKCYPGEFLVVAAGKPQTIAGWAHQYAYQSMAFAKALIEPCPDVAIDR
jgi:hypothetical protein